MNAKKKKSLAFLHVNASNAVYKNYLCIYVYLLRKNKYRVQLRLLKYFLHLKMTT